ncbi:Hypothetical_protein [Hexamita inflata]|uniref:Hypothetical_protein n=1 Tax=Hexamita inflata TaxID=28002 RepID=A0AA86QVY5_9EUKA|nr:Hypothetical protein HINF_LOCUS4156 [Hexamita inflata]CAI9960349.1 Hypothetical protein HINF_LOCUS47994 [Hexamita inflata]
MHPYWSPILKKHIDQTTPTKPRKNTQEDNEHKEMLKKLEISKRENDEYYQQIFQLQQENFLLRQQNELRNDILIQTHILLQLNQTSPNSNQILQSIQSVIDCNIIQ